VKRDLDLQKIPKLILIPKKESIKGENGYDERPKMKVVKILEK
jgi:hypothetical protein